MTLRRARLGIAALGCALGIVACRRTNVTSAPSIDAAVAPPVPMATSAPEGPAGFASTVSSGDYFAPGKGHERVPTEYDASTVTLTVGSETITTSASAEPPPVDPYDGAIARVKASAVGCFAPLPAGDYAVALDVVTSPGGTATRVDATSASVTDQAVIACVRKVGEGYGWPASPNGRTLSIDVSVRGR